MLHRSPSHCSRKMSKTSGTSNSWTEALYTHKISSMKTACTKACEQLKHHHFACLCPSRLQQNQWPQRRGGTFSLNESEAVAGLGHQTAAALWPSHHWEAYSEAVSHKTGSESPKVVQKWWKIPNRARQKWAHQKQHILTRGKNIFVPRNNTPYIWKKKQFLEVCFIYHKKVQRFVKDFPLLFSSMC